MNRRVRTLLVGGVILLVLVILAVTSAGPVRDPEPRTHDQHARHDSRPEQRRHHHQRSRRRQDVRTSEPDDRRCHHRSGQRARGADRLAQARPGRRPARRHLPAGPVAAAGQPAGHTRLRRLAGQRSGGRVLPARLSRGRRDPQLGQYLEGQRPARCRRRARVDQRFLGLDTRLADRGAHGGHAGNDGNRRRHAQQREHRRSRYRSSRPRRAARAPVWASASPRRASRRSRSISGSPTRSADPRPD